MVWFTPTNLLWLFGHLVLLPIGLLLLNAEHVIGISKELAEGIGSALVATGIVTKSLPIRRAF